MNFVAQVEENLRDLGTEARKKHPGVKEASERAILQLRTLQNAYATAVRKASSTPGVTHPTTTMFQSQDILRPFLLAANYPNASPSLLEIALKGMAFLIKNDAICPGDGVHMVRVWTIQANVCSGSLATAGKANTIDSTNSTSNNASSSGWFGGMLSTSAPDVGGATSSAKREASEKLALDLLRCLVLLLEHEDKESLSDDEWTASVNLCCILIHVHVPVVRQAAKTSVHQVLSMLFAAPTDCSVKTWQDLAILAVRKTESNLHLQGAFAACSKLPSQPFTLEVMVQILQGSSQWFADCSPMVTTQSLEAAAAVLRRLVDTQTGHFELIWRSFQFAGSLLVGMDVCGNDAFPAVENELNQWIVKTTEACRSHHDFEDGFVYVNEDLTFATKKSPKPLMTLIPNHLLWKAGFALEVTFSFLEADSSVHVDSLMAEAISDFATIAASCHDHMLQLVETRTSNPSRPSVFRRAEELQAALQQSKAEGRDGNSKSPALAPGIADTLWLALNCILELSRGCRVVDEYFAPCLAALQHYLKRFPGSRDIVELALGGYSNLATQVMVSSGDESTPLQAKALVASLCKLSLPSWGKQDASTELSDHHILALICLLKVTHSHHNNMMSEWTVIMRTLQELSMLLISSSRLSDTGYDEAVVISEVFSRLPSFSTCLDDKSLSHFMAGLIDATKGSSNMVLDGAEIDVTRRPNRPHQASDLPKDSVGGRLFDIAGRALLGGGTNSDSPQDTETASRAKKSKQRPKKGYDSDYRADFVQRLGSSKAGSGGINCTTLPFSLMLLTDVANSNSFRYSTCGPMIARHICSLAASTPSVRTYTMNTMALLATSEITDEPWLPTSFTGPGRLVAEDPKGAEIFVAVAGPIGRRTAVVSRHSFLAELCSSVASTKNSGFAESGILAVRSILENAGHDIMGHVWVDVINAVTSLSGVPEDDLRIGSDWSACSATAFSCVKLVVDDFLDQLPPTNEGNLISPRQALFDCCSSFGRSRHDLNTSLTSIGLLWTIADQDSDTASVDRALSMMVLLSSDSRPEVRNCSVNTLFSCVVGKGQGFSDEQWETCFCQTVFGAYDRILEHENVVETTVGPKERDQRYKTNIHHSRDSATKQWAATEVLVIRGLSKILRNYYSTLISTTESMRVGALKSLTDCNQQPWFVVAWKTILAYALGAAEQRGGRETLEVRTAGVDLIVLCCQLSCKAGIRAAITPARVGTNMEVVNGALRSVRDASGKDEDTRPAKLPESVDKWRGEQFALSFTFLEDFGRHIEKDNFGEGEASQYFAPTHVQVLQRLATGLAKLYECCRNDELAAERTGDSKPSQSSQRDTYLPTKDADNSSAEGRFVRVVVAIIKKGVGDQGPRFLTQAQREAFDLLRTMVAASSSEALKALALMAGTSFFWVGTLAGVDDDEATSQCDSSEALGREAATVVADEISQEALSDAVKVEVLCQVLSVYCEEMEADGLNLERHRLRKRNYALLVPVMTVGLASSSRLSERSNYESSLLQILWEKVLFVLRHMLTPLDSSTAFPYLSECLTWVALLNGAVAEVNGEKRGDLIEIMSNGISVSMDVAQRYSAKMSSDDVRWKKRYDGALEVFRGCFAGICSLMPDSSVLKTAAKLSIQNTLSTARVHGEEASVALALVTLDSITACPKPDGLIIAVFPELCRLLAFDNPLLRSRVGDMMATVDVGEVISQTLARAETAEDRAERLETENEELLDAIDELRDENDRLRSDVAVFSTSSALT